jgi:hypothetical protein
LNGHDQETTPISGPNFERFSLREGEVKVLGVVDVDIRLRPGADSGGLTSSTNVRQTVKGRWDAGMIKEMAREALALPLAWPDTRDGWEDALSELL